MKERKKITVGDMVKFKQEYRDAGDDDITFIAIDNEEKGRVTVQAQLTNMTYLPDHVVTTDMIELDRVIPSPAKTIERMRREIMSSVREGVIPASVKNFSDLHGFVDANELGGFCEEDMIDALTRYFGGNSQTGVPDGMLVYMNLVQSSISNWIESGGIVTELQRENDEMKEYRVTYREYHGGTLRVLFVKAGNRNIAKAVARDHIQRSSGSATVVINSVEEYVRPVGGHVIE